MYSIDQVDTNKYLSWRDQAAMEIKIPITNERDMYKLLINICNCADIYWVTINNPKQAWTITMHPKPA